MCSEIATATTIVIVSSNNLIDGSEIICAYLNKFPCRFLITGLVCVHIICTTKLFKTPCVVTHFCIDNIIVTFGIKCNLDGFSNHTGHTGLCAPSITFGKHITLTDIEKDEFTGFGWDR